MRAFRKISLAAVFAAIPFTVHSADLAAPYTPPAYEAPPACYAAFYARRDEQGPSLARHGPEEVPVIRHLRYANGRSLNFRVRSVTTGPAATIELYNRKHFRKLMHKIGPGSMVNLKLPVMDSYRIYCEAEPAPTYAPMK